MNDNIEVVVEEVSAKESELYDMFHVAENDKWCVCSTQECQVCERNNHRSLHTIMRYIEIWFLVVKRGIKDHF